MAYALIEAMKCLNKIRPWNIEGEEALKCFLDAKQYLMEAICGVVKSGTIAAGDVTESESHVTSSGQNWVYAKNPLTTALKWTFNGVEYSMPASAIWPMNKEAFDEFKRRVPDIVQGTQAEFEGAGGTIQHLPGGA